MIKTFGQAVKYLEQHIPTPDKKHPGELGLARMRNLMELLGNPQLKYPTIHVGGTSGKGSTSTFIASILATKYKVGLHTSPHLVKITERIKILIYGSCRSRIPNYDTSPFGRPSLASPVSKINDISDNDFVDLVNYIKPFVEKVEKSKFGPPSYFEIVAAMAFLYFYRQKVEIAVIEVGMGGRYDATNVINPLVAVITNVGLDHTEILGNTVEKIAEDKAGIIKSEVQVISGVRKTSIIRIIEVRSKKVNAEVSLLDRDFSFKIKEINDKGNVFDYRGIKLLKDLKLKLLGEYQVENASIAINAIEKLSNQQINLPTKNIRKGLLAAFIPGRLEIVRRKPIVIFDGAHNPDKAKALLKSIKDIFPHKKITAIVAIKSGKDAKEMLVQLLKTSQRVIFTRFQLTTDLGIINSYGPQVLLKIAEMIDRDKSMMVIEDARKAVEKTIQDAKPDDVILVTGSLYLVGAIKKVLSITYEKNN